MLRAKSNPLSPGIITSRMRRSNFKPGKLGARVGCRIRSRDAVAFAEQEARQQRANAAVVIDDEKVRRVVGRILRQRRVCVRHHGASSRSRARGAVGMRDQAQHAVAVLGIDHAGEKPLRRLARAGPELVEHAGDPRGLQAGKLHRQRLTCRADIEQPLAAVVGAFFLDHIAFIDELFEDAAERLFGDPQNVEQVGNLHAGIAVDEMQHAVVRAAETELGQNFVGVADKIAVGEEQKFDQIEIRLRGARRSFVPRPRNAV